MRDRDSQKRGRIASDRALLIVVPFVICALVVLGFIAYQNYIQYKIFQESSDHLHTTYEQVDKTFSMFSQRNWNVLADWDAEFASAQEGESAAAVIERWKGFVQRKESWSYKDFYLFNENCEYLTVSGRQGRDDSNSDVFSDLFSEKRPTVSSYISDGTRKIVFAVPSSSPIEVDGITYTGLAICYDNEVVQGMTTSNVFSGASDCYVIKKNGDVVLSLSPKSEFPEYVGNMYDFLSSKVSFSYGSADDMRGDVESGEAGNALCSYGSGKDVMVWQASSTEDWWIVGVVRDDAVNGGMKDIQAVTFVVVTGLFLCAGVLVLGGLAMLSRRRLRNKEEERAAIEHQKKLSDELFGGIAKIVDRFAICDLENDTYEYCEHEFDHLLYPPRGSYGDMVERMSKRYVVTSDSGNMKMGGQLSVEHLRQTLRSDGDIAHFEYAGRGGDTFKIMSMVPVEWSSSGELKKVLLCCQDIGRRVELENITRTDGLTGLFNERYFAEILHARQELKKPFTLLYLDLDRFKPVNDTYGHDVGDELLKEVARRIQGCIRDEDFAFRIGGDEFAIVLAAELADEPLRIKVDLLKAAICEPIEVSGHTVSVGASCGWARFPSDSEQAADVRKLADKYMYKDKGRNHAGR